MIEQLDTLNFDEAQTAVVQEFNQLGDIFAQYTYLIEFSACLPVMSDEEKEAASTVDKCQSQVWVFASEEDGETVLHADSDTLIVRSMLYLMLELLKGRTAGELDGKHFTFVQETELYEAFSDQRMNGFKQIEAALKQLMPR